MKILAVCSIFLLITIKHVQCSGVAVKKLESSIKTSTGNGSPNLAEPDLCCFAPAPATLYTCSCTYVYESTYDNAPWYVGQTVPGRACSGAPNRSRTTAINNCISYTDTYGKCDIAFPIPCTTQQA